METPLNIENEILISAPVAAVWDILTNPEKTVLYMYGCVVVSEWKPGDSILWIGSQDDVTYVKGEIVEIDPGHKLVYTVIDPQGKYPDIPENYLTVTYTLAQDGDKTMLKVTQGDYAKVAEGEKRYKESESQGGWQSVLDAVKELAEA
ncbi:MAG: hypothetical protein HKN76_18380 [Saprospiraceae bacterium]|nr:hypothetical protein [Saprospiraceae bacterium]